LAQSPEARRELVVRAQAGNRAAFEKLMSSHSGLVAAVVAAHLSEPGETEDVVQETFMTAWREIQALRSPESFAPWVSAIARNLARSAATQRTRRARLQPLGGPEPAPARGSAALYRRVLTEVERLPDGYREVFLLRYVQDLDCAEVSRQLGLPLGTVTSRLSRGHAMLRRRLEGIRQ
jgi:RNA polymerase sigma-70 factor (ECF subfamily)